MKRLDQKLARIRAGQYTRGDFIIADAKDGDMGPSLPSMGPKREADGSWTQYRTRSEFLDQTREIVAQDVVDIMLLSASNAERLTHEGLFRDSMVTPAVRANDTTDIWVGRGATYCTRPSRPFRTASLTRVMHGTTAASREAPACGPDLGLYSITFNNDLDADLASLEAYCAFRQEASVLGFRHFLEVFNPNVDTGICADLVPHFINDSIVRCLAGVVQADRPIFLKVAYNGPRALEELAGFDPGLVVGVLGGSAGTTRDTFELLHQAERHGARVALFGRKINLAESPLDIIRFMRAVANADVTPEEAVRGYHARLKTRSLRPDRPLTDDICVTQPVLSG